METVRGTSAVVSGSGDPLTKARLLAALLGRPMAGPELRRWVHEHDAADAVDELLACGAVRPTPGGGLALDDRRRGSAFALLARDLRL